MVMEHVDVLIVGAGLSGIGAACHLQEDCPGKTYAILESRGAIGGTWDLFRYPGIRSDSDMFTLGYAFRPWTDSKSIADGAAIRHYIEDTAREYGVEEQIRFHHQVVSADWSSADARWTVTARRSDTGETVQLTCSWLSACSGYYRYDEGFRPSFEGEEQFAGEIIHPQHWPEDFDATGKRIVVIGSGATAVTLVPSLAPDAEHVTMLQRTPSYVLSLPGRDPLAEWLRNKLPADGRLSDRAVEERPALDAAVPVQPAPSRGRAPAHPPADPEAAAGELRRRHALQPAVRPVGPAAVPRPRRRPVPHAAPRGGVHRHRPDRALHREGRRAGVGGAPRRRRRRHRDRTEPAAHGRHVADPRRRGRSTSRRRCRTRG